MEDVLVPIVVIPVIFLGLPWLIMHYITKWKQAKVLPREDEALLGPDWNRQVPVHGARQYLRTGR